MSDQQKSSSSAAIQSASRGVFSLLLTPFHQDGSIDWDVYERYVDWQASMNPAGIFAVCGSSEMKWLTLPERIQLAQVAKRIAGDLPVIATANLEPSLDSQNDELDQMVQAGVDGVVLIPQSDFAPNSEKYIEYLSGRIDQSDVPVFLYEWPQVENYLIDPSVFAAVAPRVAGIKDTTCTLEGIGQKIQVAGNSLVYQANTPFLIDSIGLGAEGYMAITSTCCADLAIETWNAATNGNVDSALMAHRELVMLDSLLVRSYPATSKYIVSRRGIPMNLTTRWPVAMAAEHARAIDAWLSGFDWGRA